MISDRSAVRSLVDGLIAGDGEALTVALELDESTVRACLAVILASVLEVRLGPAPTWGEISAAARRVWDTDGQREQLLVIEATMRAAFGFSENIRGLRPTALADAAGAIIATELNASAPDDLGYRTRLNAVAHRRLADHLHNSDS